MAQDFTKLLKNKGFKVTPARLAILSAFHEGCAPMDAEGVHKKVRRDKIDAATVYRTLAAFEKEGILRKVDLRKDAVYFEPTDEHHHHIVCTNCGLVEEFENSETEKIGEEDNEAVFGLRAGFRALVRAVRAVRIMRMK